jgi:RNA-binding protein
MAAPELTSKQRQRLKAMAHHLKPVVLVGKAGVTDAVVASVNQALLDHELIKVHLREPEDKTAMAAELTKATEAALCGVVGHTLIVYRPHPEKPVISL